MGGGVHSRHFLISTAPLVKFLYKSSFLPYYKTLVVFLGKIHKYVILVQNRICTDFIFLFSGDVVRFWGNQSAIDNFKLMETDGNFLLIGAT